MNKISEKKTNPDQTCPGSPPPGPPGDNRVFPGFDILVHDTDAHVIRDGDQSEYGLRSKQNNQKLLRGLGGGFLEKSPLYHIKYILLSYFLARYPSNMI